MRREARILYAVRRAEERSQIAGVWALKAGVSSRLRISIFRRENSGASWVEMDHEMSAAKTLVNKIALNT
ncbi:hypothetical protein cypCar_00043667 [Cyprinus carpio]|nr:hypothetical protein cypCar_00043667 [Cyprinus carpio]